MVRRKQAPAKPKVESKSKLSLLLFLIVGCLVFLTFLPVLGAEWVNWDDQSNFLNNPHYRGLTGGHLDWMWTTHHMGHYQPLSWMTLGFDYLCYGMDAPGYHLTNLLIHVVNAILFCYLLLVLLRRFGGEITSGAHWWAAGLGALFFACHPLRVESVAWVTERRDVLSMFFFLLTLLAWSGVVEESTRGRRRTWLFVAAVVCHLLSLLAKAHAVTLPFLLLIMDFQPLRRWGRGKSPVALLWEKAPFFFLAAMAAMAALWAQGSATALRSWVEHGLLARLAVAAYGTLFYLGKTILPTSLSPLYFLPTTLDPGQGKFLLAAGFLLGLGALLFWRRRSCPGAWYAFLAYLVLVAPVSGISQAGPQLVADRYTYFSCLPWAMLAAWGCHRLLHIPACRKSVIVAGGAVLLTLGTMTFLQARCWQNSVSLWQQAWDSGQRNHLSAFNLGEGYATRREFKPAIFWYEESLKRKPGAGKVILGMALANVHLKEWGKAHGLFKQISKSAPREYPDAQYYLGLMAEGSGRREEAIRYYKQALTFNPGHEQSLRKLRAFGVECRQEPHRR